MTWGFTIRKHARVMNTPMNPTLYSKTGVCRSTLFFLIFAPKHRLRVLVRNASPRRFQRVPTIYVLSKNKKNMKNFLLKSFNFYNFRKICTLHGHVFVMHILTSSVSVTWSCHCNRHTTQQANKYALSLCFIPYYLRIYQY